VHNFFLNKGVNTLLEQASFHTQYLEALHAEMNARCQISVSHIAFFERFCYKAEKQRKGKNPNSKAAKTLSAITWLTHPRDIAW
jgi:hypothetical protein